LYRDIRSDAQAQRSLDLATRLVVLQAEGLRELPPVHAAKAMVIYQSARTLLPDGAAGAISTWRWWGTCAPRRIR
jgi:hypothetical protein